MMCDVYKGAMYNVGLLSSIHRHIDKRKFADEINCAEHMRRCDATSHIAIMSRML